MYILFVLQSRYPFNDVRYFRRYAVFTGLFPEVLYDLPYREVMQDKKILSIALESERKFRAHALYTDGVLVVTHCLPISGPPMEWKNKLLKDIVEKTEKGFAVIVEDRTHNFSPHAVSFNFDEIMDDGRTMLQHCLDWYYSLDAVGNLMLDRGVETHAIRKGDMAMVNFGHDERGRLVYDVDWNRMTGGHKAILMCVAGAVMELPFSDRWLNEFAKASQSNRPSPQSPLDSFFAITTGYDEFRQRDFERSVHAGTPLSYPR